MPARLAFDPGPADGTIGTRTRDAIRQFQSIAGLPADGKPSPALLKQLRDVAASNGSSQ